MPDLIFILAICAAAYYTWYRLSGHRHKSDVHRNVRNSDMPPVSAPPESNHKTEPVAGIISRHSSDDCISVRLTAGPHSKLGKKELYRLRSGSPLWLEHSDFSGIERVKVYSGGFMVGELLLTDAERVIELMEKSRITGTYVAQSNSREGGEIDLRIMVFHESFDEEKQNALPIPLLDKAMSAPYKVRVNIPGVDNIFQN